MCVIIDNQVEGRVIVFSEYVETFLTDGLIDQYENWLRFASDYNSICEERDYQR